MKVLKHIHIKKFYSAAELSLGVSHVSRNYSDYVHDVVYRCNNCGTDFMVEHKPCGIYWNGEWNDQVVTCPCCGTHHNNFRGQQEIADEMPAPKNMRLTVTELKDAVLLSVKADTITMTKDHNIASRVYEEFRFNIKTRAVTWKQSYGERMPKDEIDQGKASRQQMEIGNPFDFAMYEHSILHHVRSDNFSRESRTEVCGVLKLLRDTIRRKWKEIRHYDIGSLFVSCGQVHGRLLFPLMNLAFRMTFPDAKNLPLWLSTTDGEVTSAKGQHGLHREGLWQDLAHIRMQESGVQGLVDAVGDKELDTPFVRKCLHEDVFQIDVLADLLHLVDNHDYLPEGLALVETIATHTAVLWGSNCMRKLDILKNLAIIAGLRDGRQIMIYMRYVAKSKYGEAYRELNDTVNLMNCMPPEILARARSVKMKDLHDFLSVEYAKYKERDYDLEVPEAVVRRLAMQMDQVKFFLPTRNAELQAGSLEFHNCVKTYAERVHAGKCQIVYMTDDRGKLTACLEVREGKLVQAKLKFNKPVSLDSAVNGAVVDWCERVGLEVATYDVRKPRYPVVLAEATA